MQLKLINRANSPRLSSPKNLVDACPVGLGTANDEIGGGGGGDVGRLIFIPSFHPLPPLLVLYLLHLLGSGVTAYSVHPGIVRTKIDRNISYYSSYVAKVWVKPWFWFFHKTPEQGTVIRSAVFSLSSFELLNYQSIQSIQSMLSQNEKLARYCVAIFDHSTVQFTPAITDLNCQQRKFKKLIFQGIKE